MEKAMTRNFDVENWAGIKLHGGPSARIKPELSAFIPTLAPLKRSRSESVIDLTKSDDEEFEAQELASVLQAEAEFARRKHDKEVIYEVRLGNKKIKIFEDGNGDLSHRVVEEDVIDLTQ